MIQQKKILILIVSYSLFISHIKCNNDKEDINLSNCLTNLDALYQIVQDIYIEPNNHHQLGLKMINLSITSYQRLNHCSPKRKRDDVIFNFLAVILKCSENIEAFPELLFSASRNPLLYKIPLKHHIKQCLIQQGNQLKFEKPLVGECGYLYMHIESFIGYLLSIPTVQHDQIHYLQDTIKRMWQTCQESFQKLPQNIIKALEELYNKDLTRDHFYKILSVMPAVRSGFNGNIYYQSEKQLKDVDEHFYKCVLSIFDYSENIYIIMKSWKNDRTITDQIDYLIRLRNKIHDFCYIALR